MHGKERRKNCPQHVGFEDTFRIFKPSYRTNSMEITQSL